jgi:hypothetical protein
LGAEDEDACLAGGLDEERRRWNLSEAELQMIFPFSGSGAGDKEPFVWMKLEALLIFFITTNVKRHELEPAVWAHTIFLIIETHLYLRYSILSF